MSEGFTLPSWADKDEVERHAYVFHPLGTGFALCVKARGDAAEVERIYTQEYVDGLTDVYTLIKPSAEIIPFPNEVADVLEHYVNLARAGHVTGVVIAALTPHGIAADPLLEHVGLSERELALLITELNDARIYALINEE